MHSKAGKLLVAGRVLRDTGHEVSTDAPQGLSTVTVFDPDVVILGADAPQLDCCGLLSEIKGPGSLTISAW